MMPIIFKLLYVSIEYPIYILISVSCKKLLDIFKTQFTSDFEIFGSTFVKAFLSCIIESLRQFIDQYICTL